MSDKSMKKVEFEFPDPDSSTEIQVEPALNRTANVLETLEMPKKGKQAKKEDDFEVEIEQVDEDTRAVKKDDVEIEIVNDTPKRDRVGKQLEGDVEDVTEEELANYNERVQKRIKTLNTRYHDQRREAEAVKRERDEIVNLAKSLLEENEKLKQNSTRSENTLMQQAKRTVEAELAAAKREYKEAYDSGDSDRLVEAQTKLSEIVAKKTRLDTWRPKGLQTPKTNVQTQQRVAPTQQGARPEYSQAPQPRQSDPKLDAWLAENSWFGEQGDPEMTSFAMGVHHKLVREGIDGNHPDYYNRLNARVREKFPEEFDVSRPSEATKPAEKKDSDSVVAPVTRSTAPRKFKLNESQVALAKRMGVPLEAYAREVAKLEMRRG